MSPRALGWALVVYLGMTLAYFMPGASWSPASRFAMTRAIVERGTFEITAYAESTGDRALVGDRFYSDKAPLPALFAVPAYAAYHAYLTTQNRRPAFRAEGTKEFPAQRVIVSPAFRTGLYLCSLSTAGACAVLLGWSLWITLRRRIERQPAIVGAVVAVLGTPLLPYGASFFGHTMAAAFLFGAFALLDPRGSPGSFRRYALCGVCLGAAAGCEYLAAVVAVPLAVWLALLTERRRRWRAAAGMLAGAVVPVAIVAAYHTVCFGAPWRTGYSFISHPAFAPGHDQGVLGLTYPRLEALWGILFSASRGLLSISPICLLALLAGGLDWKRGRDVAWPIAAMVIVLFVLSNASYYQWDGGWALGPRHIVPSLGFVGLGIGVCFSESRWRSVAALVGGWSVAVMLLSTAVGLEAPPNEDLVFEYTAPAVREGRIARISGASNLGLQLGLGRKLSLVPLVVWVIGGGAGLAALSSRRLPESPRSHDPESAQRQ